LRPSAAAASAGSAIRTACARSHGPVEPEAVAAHRLQQRPQVVEHRLGVHVGAARDEALLAQPGQHARGVALDREPGQPADRLRRPVRQPVHRAEVDDAEPAVGQQAEVARVRVGVQQPGQHRPGEQEAGQQPAGAVALRLVARRG
jgi:hypothetical protein